MVMIQRRRRVREGLEKVWLDTEDAKGLEKVWLNAEEKKGWRRFG